MSDPRQELEELRRLDELERKAASLDLGEIRKAKERTNANIYAGEDVGGMGSIMRGLGGAKHSLDSMNLGLKNLLPQSVQDAGDAVDRYLGLGGLNPQLVEQGKSFVKQAGPAASVGEFVPDIAMTAVPAVKGAQVLQAGARMLPRSMQFLAGSLPTNMTASGLTSAAVAPEDRGSAFMGGAVGAGVGEAGARVLTKPLGGLASSSVTPEARRLMDQGINVPMWKATDNKIVRDLAERAKVFPVAGNVLRGQERTSFEDFNKAMSAKATPPMPVLDEVGNVLRWENKPVKEMGSDALNTLRTRFDDAYGALYNGRSIPIDNTFGQEVSSVLAQTKAYHPSIYDEVAGAIKQASDLLRKGTEETVTRTGGGPLGNGLISKNLRAPLVESSELGHAATQPDAVRSAINTLESRIKNAYGPNGAGAEAAAQMKAVKTALEDLRVRGLPPEVASQASDINKAYASYKQLERATGSLGAQKSGMTSPAQLLNAIKANDRSPGKSQFSRGNALNQENTLLADQVLGSRLPETGPGTAEKLAPLLMFGGPMLLGDMGATALLGTKTGQRALMGQLPGQAGMRKFGNQYLVPALRAYGMNEGN